MFTTTTNNHNEFLSFDNVNINSEEQANNLIDSYINNGSYANVKRVQITNFNISAEALDIIIGGRLSNLVELSFINGDLHSKLNPILKTLFSGATGSTLTKLKISACNLTDQDVMHFSSYCSNVENSLSEISLSHNRIGNIGANHLLSMTRLNHLDRLDLSHNCISTLDKSIIPETLDLDLSSNPISPSIHDEINSDDEDGLLFLAQLFHESEPNVNVDSVNESNLKDKSYVNSDINSDINSEDIKSIKESKVLPEPNPVTNPTNNGQTPAINNNEPAETLNSNVLIISVSCIVPLIIIVGILVARYYRNWKKQNSRESIKSWSWRNRNDSDLHTVDWHFSLKGDRESRILRSARESNAEIRFSNNSYLNF